MAMHGTSFLWRGKWPVRCHVMGCARNRNASFVVLRWWHDCMVKPPLEGFRCVRGRRGRTGHGDVKVTGDSKYQLGIIYAHKWLLSWSRGLFWLKRDLETTICNLRPWSPFSNFQPLAKKKTRINHWRDYISSRTSCSENERALKERDGISSLEIVAPLTYHSTGSQQRILTTVAWPNC